MATVEAKPHRNSGQKRKSIDEDRLVLTSTYKNELERKLEAELERLKLKARMGFELKLEWSPGIVRYKNGKRLLEEVVGDTIFIYVKDLDEAIPLLTHAFLEWLLNQNTKRYRLLINKLIEVFEEMQYTNKERIIEAISRLIHNT